MNERPFSDDDVKTCVSVLKNLLATRTLLGTLSTEARTELLMAAGRLSRPDRLEFTKMAKDRRRARRAKLQAADKAARDATAIRTARKSPVYVAPLQIAPADGVSRGTLVNPRHCYICKSDFQELHFFYDAMCKKCGDYNYQKRFQTAPMIGKIAVITGARLKIGYQSALMLLRAGARVIVTTRFPRDAALRFAREEDFEGWKTRLLIYGLDLRHSPSVERFCKHIEETEDRLDILINNAAQTVRRPPGFYAHLMEEENRPFSDFTPDVRALLWHHETLTNAISESEAQLVGSDKHAWVAKLATNGGAIGLQIPAALSQLATTIEDRLVSPEFFPEGKIDADLQQIDLREMNSWRMRLADVPTPELLEVQLVNSVAPFILCRQLKKIMLRDRTDEKHIVNVSAMEGNFSRRTKTDCHPHTNMAKAALNMMTLTSAPDYATDGIFMNAVDTGWVTDEDPNTIVQRKQAEHDFQPPLDIVDGAARVCDPFFSGIITGEHVYGHFLKDYRPSSW